jgi:putative FmdB family regulatory protein
MPLYEYECDACGGRFEVIQKFSETSTECRRCGKGPVRRLMSPPAIQFKGTGWYVTDYAQKGKTGSESSAGSTKESSGDAAKSDTAAADGGKKADSTASAPASTTPSKD